MLWSLMGNGGSCHWLSSVVVDDYKLYVSGYKYQMSGPLHRPMSLPLSQRLKKVNRQYIIIM